MGLKASSCGKIWVLLVTLLGGWCAVQAAPVPAPVARELEVGEQLTKSRDMLPAPELIRKSSEQTLAPEIMTLRIDENRTVQGSKSTWQVAVTGAPDESFVTAGFYAMQLGADFFPSNVVVNVNIRYNTESTGRLGTGQSTSTILIDEVFYQVAIAEAITGTNLNGNDFDLLLTIFVIQTDGLKWYTGTDARPSLLEYDLVTVLLHESLHALFFSSLVNYRSPTEAGWSSFVMAFDAYLVSFTGCAIRGYLTEADNGFSEDIAKSVTNEDLYLGLPKTSADEFPQMYAPSEWIQGSSVVHYDLDYVSQVLGREDTLMQPAISAGFAQHTVGDQTTALMNGILGKISNAPVLCTPGTYGENQGCPDCVGSLSPTVFWVIIGCCIAFLLITVLLLLCCCTSCCGCGKKAPRKK